LVQTTATALSTAQLVNNMIQQMKLMGQTLETVNPATFSGLETILSQGRLGRIENKRAVYGPAIAIVLPGPSPSAGSSASRAQSSKPSHRRELELARRGRPQFMRYCQSPPKTFDEYKAWCDASYAR
jgi:hypothetical protein